MFFQNSSINLPNSKTPSDSNEFCRRFQDDESYKVNLFVTWSSVILYTLCCPLVIIANVLVIAAVKTRCKLQSNSNILLACLAGTDLLVGAATLPSSIAAETFAIADGSVTTYCNIINKIVSPLRLISVIASVLHLPVISVDRYIALKYSLHYKEIVTKFRIKIAVGISWFIATMYTMFRVIFGRSAILSSVLQYMMILNLLITVFCHVSVYFVSRRHEKQIRTEQMPEVAVANYREQKKAWKTTTIIIGCVFLCLLPGSFIGLGGMMNLNTKMLNTLRPLNYFFLMLNSLGNPIIYCFRGKTMRKAMIAVLTRRHENN